MSNTYRYRPLVGKDAMRVFKVQGSPDPDARLVCELVHTTLTEPLPYRAISYTWEGQAPTEDIRLEGCSLKVTKNAEAALKRFRPRNAAETTLLWIDSLCINQSADGMPERNHQVGIMGQIYAAADEVLVFLDHSRMRDFPRHRRVFKWLQEVANVPTIFDLEQRKAKLYALFSEMNPPEDMVCFYHHTPWYQRLWVVQEAAFAQSITFVWAELELSDVPLDQVISEAWQWGRSGFFSSEPLLFATLDVAIEQLSSIAAKNLLVKTIDPESFMSDSVFKLTSQSHDRLFGVHGILKAAGVELPDPDYTTPVHTSCWQYASALLKQKNCSGVLGYIHCLRPRPDIPTWVPDWSSERLPFMSDGLKIQRSASYDLQVLSDDRQLLVRGVIVDKVAERARLSFIRPEGTELNEDLGITRPLLGDTQLYTALWNIFAILSVVQLLRQRFDADLANIEAVTVLDLLFGTEQDFTPFIGNGTWHALKEYVEKVLTWRLAYIAGQSSESLASEIEDLVHVPQKLSAVEFARHMAAHPGRIPLENLSAYKTAVRLQSGRVGMAPHSVRAGDEVIMYVGADCPAIIRRVDDGSHSDGSQPRYQWVASAYIRGFMECDVLPQDRERLEYLLFE